MPTTDEITGRFECLLPERDAVTGPREGGALTMLRGPSPGFVYTLDAPTLTLGRSPDADIVIPDKGLSRLHARISRSRRGFVFEDLGSTNGSFIEGERATAAHVLRDGQRITMGTETVFGFALLDEVELSAARMTRDLAMRDPLTRLYNRRHLNDRLAAEIAYARRHQVAMSALLIDLDHFKQVNDVHGHATGDAVLRALANELAAMVRSEDVVARYGGEEFVALARGIDDSGALTFGERIRHGVAQMAVAGPRGDLRVTVSVGIGHAPKGMPTDQESLLHAADEALYQAKAEGRDRVVLLQAPPLRHSGAVARGDEDTQPPTRSA